jgi:hypothetical protein
MTGTNAVDLRKYRGQARQMAIKAAPEKAVALARVLDCTIGKPKTISEGGAYVYWGVAAGTAGVRPCCRMRCSRLPAGQRRSIASGANCRLRLRLHHIRPAMTGAKNDESNPKAPMSK